VLSRGDPNIGVRVLRALRIVEESRDLRVNLARARFALVRRE